MKKLVFLLILIMGFSTLSVSGEEEIFVKIRDNFVEFTDAVPFSKDGRTLVPVRAVANAMGASVEWNQATGTVKLMTEYTHYIILTIGEYKIKIGKEHPLDHFESISGRKQEEEKYMDVTPVIVDNRVYIPARFVGYGLGYDVVWQQNDRTVQYNYIGKQNVEFDDTYPEITTAKFPYKADDIKPGVEYSYYNGYGDVIIANADDGEIIFDEEGYPSRYTGNMFTWQFTPVYMAFDSEKFEIDTDKKTLRENVENFKAVYKEKTGEDMRFWKYSDDRYEIDYNTYTNVVTLSIDEKNNVLTIHNKYQQRDFSKYLHKDIEDGVIYNPTWAVDISGNAFACTKTTLLVLHAFLGEDGQRIWQMMNDFYTRTGKLEIEQDTPWPYNDNPQEMPLRDVLSLYGFEFVDYYPVEDVIMENNLIFKTPERQKKVIISYYGTNLSYAQPGQYFLYIYF